MEINGKIIQALPEQTGQGKNGTWRKRDYIIETISQYPKKICISVWGDKIDQFRLEEGDEAQVSIELESREYNGRWYTDVKAWKAVKQSGSAPSTSDDQETPGFSVMDEQVDDLPF